MRPLTPFLISAALASAAVGAAMAQTGPLPRIPPGAPLAQTEVRIGPELQTMGDRYGERELQDLAQVLQRRVAISAGKGGFVRADVVLEDARPNRPTIAQQSRNVSLSFLSIALGGAAVTGTLTRADGSTEPLTYSYFETDLRQERGATTWFDAGRAFDFLGDELAHGKVSHRYGYGGRPNRYDCRGYLDVWCTGV